MNCIQTIIMPDADNFSVRIWCDTSDKHNGLLFSTRNLNEGPVGTLESLWLQVDYKEQSEQHTLLADTHHMYRSFFFFISKKMHLRQFFISHTYTNINRVNKMQTNVKVTAFKARK